MSAPLQTAIDAINPNSTDEEWTRLLAEAMNAADELTALRTQVSELRADLEVADHVIGEVAKLSNPDWTEIRVYPLDTLDTIHMETTAIIGDVLRRGNERRAALLKDPNA